MAVVFAIIMPVIAFALYDLDVYRTAARQEFVELRKLRKEVRQELERLKGKPVDEAGQPMPAPASSR